MQVREKGIRDVILLLAGLLLCAGMALGQVITATIYGVVTDPSGAVIPGAAVTATSEDSSAKFSAITDSVGEFTLGSLQPGRYTITIEAQGFKAQKQMGLVLAAGQRIRITYALEVGAMSTEVEITAAAPLINTVNAEQRTNIETQQVTQLPTSRRDWTGLLNLTPGVTSSEGAVSLNGLATASLRITVDGTDSASDSEMPSLAMYQNFNFIKGVSLEAVEEVNVAKGIASAEIANTMSGNVNITTKRGTNEYHGSLFELNQVEDLNARNQFLTTKPHLVYNQFGGSAGGPIIKNKLFAFGVYEGYRLRGFQALNGYVPTPEFVQKALAAVPAYKPYFDLFPSPNQPYTPGSIVGRYIGADTEKGQDNHAVLRVDYNLRTDTIMTARYTRGRPFRQTPRVDVKNFRFWTGEGEIGSVNVIHTRGRWTSETRFGVNYNTVNRLDNIYALGVPGISGNLGFASNGETFYKEGMTWSLEEIVGLAKGRHSLRMGGIFSRMFGGRENVETPDLKYANEADFLANIPTSVRVKWGVKQYRILNWSLGLFIQDDFKISRRLVMNIGIRWDYFAVPNERDGRLFNRDGPFGTGKYRDPDSIWNAVYTNISPRFGFAYKLDEAGKTVARAGFGVFYNPRPIFGGVVDAVQNAIDEPMTITYSKADVLKYGSILRYPVVNEKVLPIAKGSQALLGGQVLDPEWGYPHSYQWTLSLQRQLTKNFALETAYIGTRGLLLMMVRDWNQPDRATGVRPYPGFATFRFRNADESSNYHAWQTTLRQRFTEGLAANINYAWSKSMNYTGDGDLLLPGSPQNIYNIGTDYGVANINTPHRLYSDILYELPLARLSSSNSRASKLLLAGWQIGAIFNARSGSPATVIQPSGLANSRPDYVGGNVYLTDYNTTLRYLNPAAFTRIPLGSASGLPLRPGNAGRNMVRGPAWWMVDMSVSKHLAITERMRLQLRADLFNAFNHTIFSGFSNDVTRSDFGVFTSTRGPRTVQVGLRLSF